MENYYELLGLEPEASSAQIKSAFRRLAKKHHPDLAVGKKAGKPDRAAEAAIRLLLEAYRVLTDPELRRSFDRSLRRRKTEDEGFDYRRFLKARSSDPASQAKLIMYDLLHNLEDEALAVYERSKWFGDFRLERWLDREEAMDAELCIAEEYEKRGRAARAYSIYKRLILMEAEKPAFRYFFGVVRLQFRTLVLGQLLKAVDEEDYLDRLEEAAGLPLPNRERAQFLRKKSELHLSRAELGAAAHALRSAAALEPRLPGLAALSRRVARVF